MIRVKSSMNNITIIKEVINRNKNIKINNLYIEVQKEYKSILSKKHKMIICELLSRHGYEVTEDGEIRSEEEIEKDPETKKAGELFKKYFEELNKENRFSREDVNAMLNLNGMYGKVHFGIGQYPILSKDRGYKRGAKNGKKGEGTHRYYSQPVIINGEEYYLMSQWRKNHISRIENWYKKIQDNNE